MYKIYKFFAALILFLPLWLSGQDLKNFAGPEVYNQTAYTSLYSSEYANLRYNIKTNNDTIYGSGTPGIGSSTMLAEDFTVPEGETWKLSALLVKGTETTDPEFIHGIHVQILSNGTNNRPGEVIKKWERVTSWRFNGSDFLVYFPELLDFAPGTYWVGLSIISDVDDSFLWKWMYTEEEETLGLAPACFQLFNKENKNTWKSLIEEFPYKSPNLSFVLYSTKSNDLGVCRIVSPTSGESLASETVSVMLRNYGSTAQSNFEVNYSINGVQMANEAFNGTLNAGDSSLFTFQAKADLSTPGKYKIAAGTTLAGDEYTLNDSTSSMVQNYGTVYRINDYTESNIVTCSGLFTDQGGIDGKSQAGVYTATIRPDGVSRRISLTFTQFVLPYLDTLYIYDGESDKAPLLGAWGSVTSSGPTKPIVATNAAGALTVKFSADHSYQRDGWIAEINCEKVLNDDLGITGVISPLNGDNMSDDEAVKVVIKNYGLFTQQNFEVMYTLAPHNQVSQTIKVVELVDRALATGDTLEYTFKQKAALAEPKTWILKAETLLQNDVTPENDSFESVFTNHGLVYRMDKINGLVITANAGKFTDDGGIDGGYKAGDYITTFVASDKQHRMRFDFTSFRLYNGSDSLFIYDGNSVNAPLLGVYTYAASPGIITATNADGAFTFRFIAESTTNRDGWVANISEVAAKENDLCITKLIAPLSGEDKTANEVVSVRIKNMGWQAQNNFNLSYAVYSETGKLLAQSTEVFENTLENGDFFDYTFALPVDLQLRDNYRFELFTRATSDENIDDTLVSIVTNYGKVYRISDYDKGSITACSGTFADEGGLDSYFVKETNYSTTLVPGETGKRVSLFFTSFFVGFDGTFTIYDGADNTAPKIGTWSYGNLSGEVKATNAAGALTVEFDGPTANEGWDASITCFEPFADDFAFLGSSVLSTPAMLNVDNQLVLELSNRGSMKQAKEITVLHNGKSFGTFSTPQMNGGTRAFAYMNWKPDYAGLHHFEFILPKDDETNTEDTLRMNLVSYEKGSMFESFEGKIFPPEFWHNTGKQWKRVNETASYADPITHGDYCAHAGTDSETFIDTLVTPPMYIKDGDVLRFKAMYVSGWLDMGWIENETGIFHKIDKFLEFDYYKFKEYIVDISEAKGISRLAFISEGGCYIDDVAGPKMYLPDYDLTASGLQTAPVTCIGDSARFSMTIANKGVLNLSESDYTLTLYQKGNPDVPLKSYAGIALESLGEASFEFAYPFKTKGMKQLLVKINLPGDANLENNQTATVKTDVYPLGMVSAQLGTGSEKHYKLPMAMGSAYSLTQTIYPEQQINKVGKIGGLSYAVNFAENQSAVRTKIYMGIAADSVSNGQWASLSSLTLVLNRDIDYQAMEGELYLSLDNSFEYTGGHLVVLVYKETEQLSFDQVFYQSAVPYNAAYTVTASNALDLNNPGTGIQTKFRPNTRFYFDSEIGVLSMKVCDKDGVPFEKAQVNLRGDFSYSGKTNNNGELTLSPVMANRNYELSISVAGYEKHLVNPLEFNKANIALGEIRLQPVEIPFSVIAKPYEDIYTIEWKHESEATYDDPVFLTDVIENVYRANPNTRMYAGNIIHVSHPGTLVGAFIWGVRLNGSEANVPVKLAVLDNMFHPVAESEPVILPNMEEIYVDMPKVSYNSDFYLMVYWDSLPNTTNHLGYDSENPGNYGFYGNMQEGFTAVNGAFTILPAMYSNNSVSLERNFVGYDIYRGKQSDIATKKDWVKLNNVPVKPTNNSVLYYDYSWPKETPGEYMYGVRSVYSNDTAEWVYSNLVHHLTSTSLVVKAEVNGGTAEGTKVVLQHSDNLGVHRYTLTLNNQGLAVQDIMARGIYTLSVNSEIFHNIELENISLNKDSDTLVIHLEERIQSPVDVKVKVNHSSKTALVTWNGYNDTTQMILDDGSYESGILVDAKAMVRMGNLYKNPYKGKITSAQVYGLEVLGKKNVLVTLDVIDTKGTILGTSKYFEIPENDWGTVEFFEPVNFNGDFYAMVHWEMTGDTANVLAQDTDGPHNGKSLAYFENNGYLFPLSEVANGQFDGIFAIRPSVVIEGFTDNPSALPAKTETGNSELLSVIKSYRPTKPVIARNNKRSENYTYNLYLDNMNTPLVKGITNLYYELNKVSEGNHLVGVSTAYASGESQIVTAPFWVSANENLVGNISLYPNPGNGTFECEIPENGALIVHSPDGVEVYSIPVSRGKQQINLTHLPEGTYTVNIECKTQLWVTKLVIIK